MKQVIHGEDLPLLDAKKPWAQVEWLFDSQATLAATNSAASNYRNSKKHFIAFLKEFSPGALSRGFSVNRDFDEYTLLRFKQYVDDLSFSSSYSNTILACARKTLRTAVASRWIEPIAFIDFVLDPSSRETDVRAPYSERETTKIMTAVSAEIRTAQKLLKPYIKTGLGEEPYTAPDGKGGLRYPWGWWRNENNMRWYFENELDCQPITGVDPAVRARHRSFLLAATNFYGGLHRLYERWGVSAWIGPETVLPYLYKLVAETGLNPTVAMALRLDDYVEEHPLTKRSYIRYWKERGSGEGELHLDLLDTGVLMLDERQSRDAKKIWQDVMSLTGLFRGELPSEIRERLFVYQSRGVKTAGQARDFLMDNKTTGGWARQFLEKHQIRCDSGELLNLTLARFRPSLVSRMLKRGVDILIIKSILGHRSVLTTLRYVESYDFNPRARKEVQRSLENIRENRRQQEESPKPIAEAEFETGKVVFTTGLALCKNVFNPPANVRKAAGIKPGSPCGLFNMCLRCPNVLILEDHLPQLFALRRQYLVALEEGLSATPHRAAIQQNLHVLNGLLEFGSSDWSEDVLRESERRSEFIDATSDPVAIREVAG